MSVPPPEIGSFKARHGLRERGRIGAHDCSRVDDVRIAAAAIKTAKTIVLAQTMSRYL